MHAIRNAAPVTGRATKTNGASITGSFCLRTLGTPRTIYYTEHLLSTPRKNQTIMLYMFGIILIAAAGVFEETGTVIGKYQVAHKKESLYAMGFLSSIWAAALLLLLKNNPVNLYDNSLCTILAINSGHSNVIRVISVA